MIFGHFNAVRAKIFSRSEFVQTFVAVRLCGEPYYQKLKNEKYGVTTLVSEISCVVDRAKLPDLVNVAVVGLIYFWRKMKTFRPVEGRRCDEIPFE